MALSVSDVELVVAARSDPQAFAGIFERHHDAVWRYLARRAGATVADDLTGEVFVVALQALDRFDTSYPSTRPWLLGIATNLLRAHGRAEGRLLDAAARDAAGAALVQPDIAAAAADRVAAGRRSGEIAAALRGLRSEERHVLLLSAWEDLTPIEIAAVLQVPVVTVRTRLHRARRRVADVLAAADALEPLDIPDARNPQRDPADPTSEQNGRPTDEPT